MIRVIAKRYAKALVELSSEKKIVDKTKADLAAFVAVVNEHAVLQKLFASPAFTPAAKKAVIGELSAKLNIQETTRLFIEHLAESGRIRYLRDVYEAFDGILAEQQNRAPVRLTTAAPLSAQETAAIKKELETITGKHVEIEAHTDASVIGGALAQIGSVIYDGTIKNQLGKMRARLAR